MCSIIEHGDFTGTIRRYDRYGMFFSRSIGYRMSPDGSLIPLYYGEIKIDANDQYHIIPRTRPSNNWEFTEVWIDPMLSPPYLLLLLGDRAGNCRIYDPAENYKIVFSTTNYEEAKLWLLEDEYEPIEGRLKESELL